MDLMDEVTKPIICEWMEYRMYKGQYQGKLQQPDRKKFHRNSDCLTEHRLS